MEDRTLGGSGIQVSLVSFGAGPISGLMVGQNRDAQCAAVERAVAAKINWFDTAASYGEGQSERNLGAALQAIKSSSDVGIATKVRLMPE